MGRTGALPMAGGRPRSAMPLFGLSNGSRRGLMVGDAVDGGSGREPRAQPQIERDDFLVLVHGDLLVWRQEPSTKSLLVIEAVEVAPIQSTVGVAESAHSSAATDRAGKMRRALEPRQPVQVLAPNRHHLGDLGRLPRHHTSLSRLAGGRRGPVAGWRCGKLGLARWQ